MSPGRSRVSERSSRQHTAGVRDRMLFTRPDEAFRPEIPVKGFH